MDYAKISKETFRLLYQTYDSLKNSPLKETVRAVIEVRVSEINGCAYCLSLHSEEARRLGIAQEKLDALSTWYASELFDEDEKCALQWAELLTTLDQNLEEAKKRIFDRFSEREAIDLTTSISLMNALNRIAISLKE